MSYFDKNRGIILEPEDKEVFKEINKKLINKEYNCPNILKTLSEPNKYKFK